MNSILENESEKVYRIVELKVFRSDLLERIQSLQELYALDEDSLIIIARTYKWDEDEMQDKWFDQP